MSLNVREIDWSRAHHSLNFLAILSCLCAPSQEAVHLEDVELEFHVRVPDSTPVDAVIFLGGNVPGLGEWNPQGLRLQKSPAGDWLGHVRVRKDLVVEFKVTRGSWTNVEKGPRGEEIKNRRVNATTSQKVELVVANWAPPSPRRRPSTLTGKVRFHDEFASRLLAHRRRIAVYLPPDYEKDPLRRYPVLYLNDGQNMFDAATSAVGVEWGADEAADRLIREKLIEPLILVAIGNSPARVDEYTPTKDSEGRGGQGQVYERFLLEELKPFIDASYRTRPGPQSTGIGGSSLGALISLDLAHRNPGRFGLCAAFSPSLGWAEESLLRSLERGGPALRGVKVWIDMGTNEGANGVIELERARRLAHALESDGHRSGLDLHYLEAKGATHHESAWAARFPSALEFLFGTSKP